MFKEYKKFMTFSLISMTIISFLACSTSDSSSAVKIGKIDISDAKALIVSPKTSKLSTKSSTRNTNDSDKVFRKIKSDGSIDEVICTNLDGEQINVIPDMIYNATNDYLIIVIDSVPYLVNKNDGAAYDLSPVGNPEMLRANGGYDGEIRKSIYADENGNIYYINSGIVKKIDVSNPESITVQNYTPDIYSISSVNEFAVDKLGNVFFSYDINFQEYTKIKKIDGSLEVITYPSGAQGWLSFTGYDGNIYYYGTSYKSEASQGRRWLYMENLIFVVQSGIKTELYRTIGTKTSKSLDFLSSSNLKMIKYSSKYYYVATQQGKLLKVDPDDNDSYNTLVDSNYDFFKMDVTNDDIVVFNALRLSDSKKVIGTISSDGTVTIIDDTLVDDVIILQRVN